MPHNEPPFLQITGELPAVGEMDLRFPQGWVLDMCQSERLESDENGAEEVVIILRLRKLPENCPVQPVEPCQVIRVDPTAPRLRNSNRPKKG